MSETPSSPADDVDPRPAPADALVDVGDGLAPAVAHRGQVGGPWMVGGGAVLMGLVVFAWLASHRPHAPAELATSDTAPAAGTIGGPIPIPPDLAAAEAAGRGTGYTPSPQPSFVIPTPQPGPAASAPLPNAASSAASATRAVSEAEAAQRRKAPALVVDLAGPGTDAASNTTASAAGSAAGAKLNSDEQFAQRAENDVPQRSKATQLTNLPTTIPQGVLIPGVLETALNSDLPGFTRAVVSRDVRGFDGGMVLVPRGSRMIGEYRSAASQGASRAFVIWTRIIRPDGVSIQIGSSGTDTLGRAGLEGKVDRHFFERFGGAVLLSVVDIGVSSALARENSSSVYLGGSPSPTGGGFTDLTNIPPTIKVPQGAPIRIFVARDLDFSGVKPVAPASP